MSKKITFDDINEIKDTIRELRFVESTRKQIKESFEKGTAVFELMVDRYKDSGYVFCLNDFDKLEKEYIFSAIDKVYLKRRNKALEKLKPYEEIIDFGEELGGENDTDKD